MAALSTPAVTAGCPSSGRFSRLPAGRGVSDSSLFPLVGNTGRRTPLHSLHSQFSRRLVGGILECAAEHALVGKLTSSWRLKTLSVPPVVRCAGSVKLYWGLLLKASSDARRDLGVALYLAQLSIFRFAKHRLVSHGGAW